MRIYERKLCLCMLVAGGDGERLAAVNLGGWLVIEKWIKPSIWEGIPNDDLLVLFFTILLKIYRLYHIIEDIDFPCNLNKIFCPFPFLMLILSLLPCFVYILCVSHRMDLKFSSNQSL